MSLKYIQPQQQQKKSGGILGTLGTLATLAGMATGQPWLGMLGTGLGAADTLMNGGSSSSGGSYSGQTQATSALGKVLNGVLGELGLAKLSDNNIAQSAEEQAKEKIGTIVSNTTNAAKRITPPLTDAELAAKWGNGGYYTTPGWINSTNWRF